MGVKSLIERASSETEEETSWLDKPHEKDSGRVRCPECRNTQTEKKEYYYRCDNEECHATTFIPINNGNGD